MISYIKGKILTINENSISVLNDNIGYLINLPLNKISSVILTEGQEIEVFTQMIVRENDISLWGFLDSNSQKMFNTLLDVSGVGPRTAQNMVFEIGIEQIVSSINMGDPSKLKVTGVGLKTAEKIIIELKNKINDKFKMLESSSSAKVVNMNQNTKEAIAALVALGYREQDAVEAIKHSDMSELDSTQDIIKKVLKQI
ncbi:MAG: Holliday junction branch migration protein RuvA [Candidatus Dojkabacteria bacterium]